MVWIEKALDHYETLNMRERLLIGITICALTWMSWQLTLSDSLNKDISLLHNQVASVTHEIGAEIDNQRELNAAREVSPDKRLHAQREQLINHTNELRVQLESAMDHFVTPERMPLVLEDLLRNHKQLKLKRLASLQATPVEMVSMSVASGDAGPAGVDNADAVLFRHAIRLEIEGSYFDLLGYLAELEASPWHFVWRDLQYNVLEYPQARVVLTLETLSRDKNWIGV